MITKFMYRMREWKISYYFLENEYEDSFDDEEQEMVLIKSAIDAKKKNVWQNEVINSISYLGKMAETKTKNRQRQNFWFLSFNFFAV